MIKVRLTLEGIAPLLMHNIRLADPLDPYKKALAQLTSKRKKTDDDYVEMARLEFFGGMYHDADLGPYIPGANVEACLRKAGGLSKQSKKIERGLMINELMLPLIYKGPRDLEALWEDPNHRLTIMVRVTGRVPRCRPKFDHWVVEADADVDPSILDTADLERIAEDAGVMMGLGDWRPRYGRFKVTAEVL